MISLGFSVKAEHAHQNQGRPHILSLLDQRTNANHKHGRGIIQNQHATINLNQTLSNLLNNLADLSDIFRIKSE